MNFRQRIRWIVVLTVGMGLTSLVMACAPPPLPTPTPLASPQMQETPLTSQDIVSPTLPAPTLTPSPTLPPPSLPTMRPPIRRDPLTGVTWELVRFSSQGAQQQALTDRPATLIFEDGRISGNTGCNGFTGSYTLDGAAIQIELGPMTMRACMEEVADQEAAVLFGLQNATTFRVEDATLALLNAEGEPLLVFRAQPSQNIINITWVLAAIPADQNLAASSNADLLKRVAMTFHADGRLSGKAGCNTFRGEYSKQGRRLEIGPLTTTRMMCDDKTMALESAVLQSLQKTASFTLSSNRLTLFDGQGKPLLQFTPAP